MKIYISKTTLILIGFLVTINVQSLYAQQIKEPNNYTIILDLSDRILNKDQVEKDIAIILRTFKKFEIKARRGLILTSKDRFSVKIIPQKNSPLDINYFQNSLQIYLDELQVQDKNKYMTKLSTTIASTLTELSKQCRYGKNNSDYSGVDIWSYLNDYGNLLSKTGYKNTVIIITDGYFDFEDYSNVLNDNNKSTSTRFLIKLSGLNWEEIADEGDYGLIPIQLDQKTKWIISGINSKRSDDILQTKKIIYIWKKWLKESGVSNSHFILNNSESEITSRLLEVL